MTLDHVLEQVRDDLDGLGLTWSLLGGLAVSVRAEPRFTRDIDVAVAVADDLQADAVIAALHRRGYMPYMSVDQIATGRLATERLWAPGRDERVSVDLLFASSGIEAEVCERAERVAVVPGLVLPVARAGHLVALKLLSHGPDRPRDMQDLMALRAVLDEGERELAREAVAQILARGTHRGRDLARDLEGLIAPR